RPCRSTRSGTSFGNPSDTEWLVFLVPPGPRICVAPPARWVCRPAAGERAVPVWPFPGGARDSSPASACRSPGPPRPRAGLAPVLGGPAVPALASGPVRPYPPRPLSAPGGDVRRPGLGEPRAVPAVGPPALAALPPRRVQFARGQPPDLRPPCRQARHLVP